MCAVISVDDKVCQLHFPPFLSSYSSSRRKGKRKKKKREYAVYLRNKSNVFIRPKLWGHFNVVCQSNCYLDTNVFEILKTLSILEF